MPRQNRRRVDAPRPSGGGANERREDWAGEDYAVRTVSGHAAVKAYRCPGCDQLIQPGVAHVAAWPAADLAADARRHWHRACWDARARRGPGGRRPVMRY